MNFILMAVAYISWSSFAWGDTQLCDHVIVKDGKIKLATNEKILICGTDKSVEGWREIPLPQAEYGLNVLLQNRGYLQPRFERDGETLFVWTGPQGHTKALEVKGAEGILHAGKKRKIVGYPMEPDKLDEVTNWADLNLRRRGYACPDIQVAGQIWDQKIIANINEGDQQRIAKLDRSGLEGLDEESISRFQAFEIGDLYDVVDTNLTASRMLDEGLFQSAYITKNCRGKEVDLRLVVTTGKPRLFRFGLGASTEEFPFADVWLKNTRLDNRASNFTIRLHGSNRKQSLNIDSELYRLPWTRRTFLGPRFSLKREYENSYETVETTVGADLGRDWDMWKARYNARVGPTLNYLKTVQGVGLANSKFLSWEGSLATVSHGYEQFLRDQFEGWTASFSYKGQREGVGSPINVDRYAVAFKNLWNLGAYSPPLFVLAARLEGVTVDSRQVERPTERALLPVSYRVFYGGDENLRGFGRKSLDNAGLGYLTAVYAGFELRMVEELPYKIEPFLLWDAGRLGNQRYTLDAPLYTSYGFGLRWASPFGTLRGSAAKGDIANATDQSQYPREWVYFFSFGQEF